MLEFISGADIYLKTFWYIAIPVSTIFIVQTILTFAGIGEVEVDGDTEMSHVGGTFELFTLRNIINFLLGFSWAGIGFYNSIENKILLIIASLLVGVIFVAIFFYLIQQMKRLEEDNTFDINQIMGLEASVYLRIPKQNEGSGKIHVSHQGSMHELEAISSDGMIPTGETVLITNIGIDQIITVQRIG
jgi:hypothetical protein